MKDKTKMAISIMTLLAQFSCTLDVNNTDPHASKTMEESQRDGFFITEYSIVQTPENMFRIGKVWQEKTWYYKIKNWFQVEKELRTNTCEILLETTESESSKYKQDDAYNDWELIDEITGKSLGYMGGHIWLPLNDCNVINNISIALIKEPKGKRERIGKIILTPKR